MPIYRIFFILILLTPFICTGETTRCPTPTEIKMGTIGFWIPLYIDGEELISAADEKLFKESVQQFHFAEWHIEYLENGHCFYLGSHSIMNQVILAQDAYRPVPFEQWYWFQPGRGARCFESSVACGFVK